MSSIDIVEIKEIVDETPKIKSFYFDWDVEIKPGQFVMVWIPGVDEIPMSLSRQTPEQSITVRNVGKSTEYLHDMEEGERIGLRGPYGHGYDLEGDEILAVIGGIGGASILPAVSEAVRQNKIVYCALGGETEEELLFREEMEENTHLNIATDDGSVGHHGFVTEMVEDLIEKKDIDQVITCGPEIMMKKTVEIALGHDLPVQASLERYMKCGLGLCDSCTINGYQVCKDGPVFNGKELSEMEEFGKFERDKTGKKVELH
ncbi:MAG: dihydroorotate dehydrogenase electron transfer subunit [Thermoplasmatota archaeon]